MLTPARLRAIRTGAYWRRLEPSRPGRVELPDGPEPSDADMVAAAERTMDVPAGSRGVVIDRVVADVRTALGRDGGA